MTAVAQEKATKYVIPPVLLEAEKLRQERKLDEAMSICVQYMNEHFEDIPSMTLAAHIMMDAERWGMAQPLMLLASKIASEESIVWNNLGLCYYETGDIERAEDCYIKALKRDPNDWNALNNLARLYNDKAQPMRAIQCAEKALKLNPKIAEVRYNRGIALLSMGQWEEGWKGYEYNLGQHRGRRERVFGTIPRWTGVKGLTLIAYGEQGLGDEISFASCLPDLIAENNVIIECDHRLEGLFRRSFGVKVYGTRYIKGGISWPTEYQIDASVALGSLPGFYRNSTESFPGTPYLKADPLRRIQWRALLDSLGDKPKIGLTWTGGLKRTGSKFRSLDLEDLKPILSQDATFISLQYKPSPEVAEMKALGFDIHHFPHGTETKDIDDTAALIAELDLVITVQQTAVHLAGALGVPTWVLTPKATLWRYLLTGDTLPWYKSVCLYRQRDKWVEVIAQVGTDLRKFCLEKKRAGHVVPDHS